MLAALLLAASLAAAQAPACRPVPGIGCFLPREGSRGVIVYFRGHPTRRMPSADVTERAIDAVDQYGLANVAAARRMSLLVTGSSDISVNRGDVEAAAGGPVDVLIVAAHSGGRVGLTDSLPHLGQVDAIALLDCFYGIDDGGLRVLARQVKRLVESGATCGGFRTPHNASRWLFFKAVLETSADRCRVDALPDGEHDNELDRKLLLALRPRVADFSASAPKGWQQ